MKKFFLLFIICLFIFNTNGQNRISAPEKIYKLNYKTEIPLTCGMFGLNILGFSQLSKKSTLNTFQINSLNKNDVWAFDRRVFSQSYPAPSQIYNISDWGLWTSYLSPALLFLDKEIRKSWGDIALLYFETQAINLNIYLWGGPVFTKRIRPIVYFEGTSMEYKLGQETTDSFYSGHTAMVAGASFFIAKVINDYHPELNARKWLLYGAALIPPVIVGYWRYRGFMHFPSDILLGTIVGSATGILVPHLHKITSTINKDLSIIPFTGRYSGLAFSMRF
jgi:membrane-associated phospholipid phosphatase